MKIGYRRSAVRGFLIIDIIVAISLIAIVLFPLAMTFSKEERLCRNLYNRAVAMEIVDGEMEFLLAGEYAGFQSGVHDYAVNAVSAINLPPGRFELTVRSNLVRLCWIPDASGVGGKVTREAVLRQ
ncbi:MAG: hypothetical protein K9N52_07870 [Verrucomicrobia bacterium]|nr:hypothetical protein [Verrucomicrobiota bacterium]